MRFSRLRRIVLCCVGLLGVASAGFLLLDWWFPFPTAALRRPPAVVVTDREGTPLRIFLPPDGRLRLPVELHEVAPVFVSTLIASEDRWFYSHPGVNPLAVLRALWSNLRERRVVSGASTIAMQIARMAEPKRRTLWAKGWEMFRALQLERQFGKGELLELYLNLTPYGGNVEGVGAATAVYFGKTPAQLSLGESALLAVLPRAPSAYNPARNPTAARTVRDRILRHLAARHVFPGRAVADALRHPVVTPTWRAPLIAPHFCQLVFDHVTKTPRIPTTLDLRTQRVAEEQVSARIAMLRARGIGSAAVVVIENGTRAVRALVGSPGFFEVPYEGQVNGATARRSPGSALKPFLYAMAMDTGRTVPDSYLLDVPTDFAGYVPENYDGRYSGRVTVRESLIRSLNVPAVRLLAEVGVEAFHNLLLRGGLSTLTRPPAAYGLPLVLGSGEVSLLDLTNFYATLADGGLHRPVQLQPGPVAPGERLFSPEATHFVTRTLTALQRPDLPRAWNLTRDAPTVAWKTGTSYGHRDAWSVGFSSRYTVGVWVGNFDGRGQKGISGSEHAAPLLFDLFRAIENGAARLPEPADLRTHPVQVCALSHELPGPFCPLREAIPVIPGRSKLSTCTYHQRVFIDAVSGDLLTGACLATRPHRAATLTVYPPELVAWWQGPAIPPLPQLSPYCQDIPAEVPLRIVSPGAATPYRLRRDTPAIFQHIPLVAQSGATGGRLYWYQDGLLVASGTPDAKLLLPLHVGSHRLVVIDATGRSAGVTYRVE